ncbi:class I adenylate-forming enzyme family protein [uncultured Roseobacter sp.]|uniref:class I adenylate-forming enzyme family protein n=1 Tax=uncultured Roseobacter sp. TaxID=114847 RepID=UPI0026129C03|nr:AMP-binding protein [uncultured Roseobacter sp.]
MTAALWNQFVTIVERRMQAPAVLAGEDVMSFEALRAAAERLAANIDVEPEARVVICANNSPLVIAAVAAIWRSGAIPVLVNAEAPTRHLLHAIDISQPDLVLGSDTPPEVPSGVRYLDICRTLPAQEMRQPAAEGKLHGPGSIVFTSGSTGMPKGVTQSCANLRDGAARIAAHLGYRPDDRILVSVPFSFDYGWGQVLSLLLEGIALVLPVPRNGFGVCSALDTHSPTVFAGVPAVFADLLSGLAPLAETRRDIIRLITNTGSKIPTPIYDRLLEHFPQADISLNYGLTETYRTASLPVELARSHPTSVGHAVLGVEIDILRPDGSRADVDEEGEIIHRGAGTFLGYWNDPETTARILRPDPLNGPDVPPVVFTGDMGWKDSKGLLHISGRRDRQLKSMGVRVSPDEIEVLLADSGLLDDAAVTALPHDVLGDMIVAAVVPGPEMRDDEKALLRALKAHARKTMSPYMQPRQYVVLQTLPRNPNKKVNYQELASLLRIQLAPRQ